MNIHKIIEKIRLREGLKAEGQVALLLRLTKQNLSNYKKRGVIPYKELITYCEQSNLSLDWLLNSEEFVSESEVKYGEDTDLTKAKTMVEHIFHHGDDQEKAMVKSYIEKVYNLTKGRGQGNSGGSDKPRFHEGEKEQKQQGRKEGERKSA